MHLKALERICAQAEIAVNAGSTVIVLAPKGFVLMPGLQTGSHIRMGQALMRWPG